MILSDSEPESNSIDWGILLKRCKYYRHCTRYPASCDFFEYGGNYCPYYSYRYKPEPKTRQYPSKLIIFAIIAFVAIIGIYWFHDNYTQKIYQEPDIVQLTSYPISCSTYLEQYATSPTQIQEIPTTRAHNAVITTTTQNQNQNLNLKTSPKTQTYRYTIRMTSGSVSFTTYAGVSNMFSSKSHSYYNNFETETIGELLENREQDVYMKPFVDKIMDASPVSDERVRIATNLVQHIHYGNYKTSDYDWYYPYETLYYSAGVCADKSILLAYLLNNLGYDTVLFDYPDHMAVGIKTYPEYDFYDTGYAFIESTRPNIITYIPKQYAGGFTITPTPHIIHLNGGTKTFDAGMEYSDATRMKQLENMGNVLDVPHYEEWRRITAKYDLQYDT